MTRLRHAEHIENVLRSRDGYCPVPAGDDEGDGGVLGGGEGGEEVVLLEDESDVLLSEAGFLTTGHLRDVLAEDFHDAALVGVEDAGDDGEERGFAAAGGADDHGHLAGVDVPVDAAEGHDFLLSVAESFGDVADVDGDREGVVGRIDGVSFRLGDRGGHESGAPARVLSSFCWRTVANTGTLRTRDPCPFSPPRGYPRKTTAGSRTTTRRIQRILERMQMKTTAAPVSGSSCQGVK